MTGMWWSRRGLQDGGGEKKIGSRTASCIGVRWQSCTGCTSLSFSVRSLRYSPSPHLRASTLNRIEVLSCLHLR
eukprot:5918216-Pyramimonas_sp.AAC.1